MPHAIAIPPTPRPEEKVRPLASTALSDLLLSSTTRNSISKRSRKLGWQFNLSRIERLAQCSKVSLSPLVDSWYRITRQLLEGLALLTVGPQLRGGHNVKLGLAGIVKVFDAISSIVAHAAVKTEPNCIELKTAAGCRVLIAFSSERISQTPNKPFERMPEKRAPLNSVDDITEKKRT
jgi:hypothetical protein